MFRQLSLRPVAVLTAAALSLATPAFGIPQFIVKDLGTLGGATSNPGGFNNLGQVAGYSRTATGEDHAFLYSDGTMLDLGTFGGKLSEGLDINALGEVVGFANPAGDTSNRAFVYRNGSKIDFSPFGATNSTAYGINNLGQVVGGAYTPNGERAFLYANGVTQDLGTLGGGFSSRAHAINNLGQVTGLAYLPSGALHGFFHNGTTMTDLGTLGDASTTTWPTDINDAGQIVGFSYLPNGAQRAFLYDSTGMHNLGTLPGLTVGESRAYAINNRGDIVGHSSKLGGFTDFLYTDGVMYDLHTLLAPGTTWSISSTSDINDRGEILVTAAQTGGQAHAVILVPVPEPAGILATGAALLAFTARMLRRRAGYAGEE